MRPSRRLSKLIVGVLARAQRRYPVQLIGFVVLSNHVHFLLWAEDAEQLADFMEYALGNIAREAGLLHDWPGKFWGERYRPIAITDEEPAQVARLRYLLAQGCKEGLVLSPLHWPGPHASSMILSGRPQKGIWVDRTSLYRARQRQGEKVRPVDHEEPETLELAQLPCWSHLTPEQYRQQVAALVQEIEEETAARHRREGTRPLGRRAVLKARPHTRPEEAKQSPAPLVHAATLEAREAFVAAYRWFVASFREASVQLRAGRRDVKFPEGSFPPGLPFVRPGPLLRPG